MLIVFASLLATMLSFSPPDPAPAARAALTAERIDAMLTAPTRRVRAMDPALASAVADGVRRSYTFARLLRSVDDGDLIVYVESNAGLPLSLAGRLMLVPASRAQRYVRIELAPLGDDDLIATLAHELQHALEIAEAPDVRDEAGLAGLYRRIGHTMSGRDAFDTVAARAMGRTVKNELAG